MKKLLFTLAFMAFMLLFGGKLEGCTAGTVAKVFTFVTIAGVIKCGFFQHRDSRFYYRIEAHNA